MKTFYRIRKKKRSGNLALGHGQTCLFIPNKYMKLIKNPTSCVLLFGKEWASSRYIFDEMKELLKN